MTGGQTVVFIPPQWFSSPSLDILLWLLLLPTAFLRVGDGRSLTKHPFQGHQEKLLPILNAMWETGLVCDLSEALLEGLPSHTSAAFLWLVALLLLLG